MRNSTTKTGKYTPAKSRFTAPPPLRWKKSTPSDATRIGKSCAEPGFVEGKGVADIKSDKLFGFGDFRYGFVGEVR